MTLRRLPGTDLDLSTVGFGCWAAGKTWWGDDVDDAETVAAMHAALDSGINWFDTAPLYGHGHADQVLTRALADRRDRVIIATKVGVRWDGEGQHAESDLTASWLRADVEASLIRLGLTHIDLLQVHWPCQRGTPLVETMATLGALRREGKIRWVGLCNYNAQGVRAAVECGAVHSLQTPYSLLRREFERELGPACADTGPGGGPLGVLAYEPLCRGLLTGKYGPRQRFPESDMRARDDRFQGGRYLRALTIVSRLSLLARRMNVPVAALALAWALRQPAITAVIAGAKRVTQVQENQLAMALAADDAQPWDEVDRVVAAYRG